jgi:hypothetical protein
MLFAFRFNFNGQSLVHLVVLHGQLPYEFASFWLKDAAGFGWMEKLPLSGLILLIPCHWAVFRRQDSRQD